MAPLPIILAAISWVILSFLTVGCQGYHREYGLGYDMQTKTGSLGISIVPGNQPTAFRADLRGFSSKSLGWNSDLAPAWKDK